MRTLKPLKPAKKQKMITGPNGEKRPISDVSAAMKVGRVSVGIEQEREETVGVDESREIVQRKVIVRDWKREPVSDSREARNIRR